MDDIHLLVPDLFWPAAAGSEPCRELRLPALETLFARGRTAKTEGTGLERWLAAAYALPPELPLAPFSLGGDGGDPANDAWMQADPVHLKVHGGGLVLADASRLSTTGDEAREFIAALNSHFAQDGMTFVAPHPQRWYARLAEEPRVYTTPTTEVAGRNIDAFLPSGEEGARWHRFFNEAQMVLHDLPRNAAREAGGALPVNSVWFWGAGRAWPLTSPYEAVWASHPLAAGLAAAASSVLRPLPSSAAACLKEPGEKSALIVAAVLPATAYGDVSGWREAAVALDKAWCAPLVTALQDGTLQNLTLHGLGSDYGYTATLTRQDRLRFWRRKRPLSDYAA